MEKRLHLDAIVARLENGVPKEARKRHVVGAEVECPANGSECRYPDGDS